MTADPLRAYDPAILRALDDSSFTLASAVSRAVFGRERPRANVQITLRALTELERRGFVARADNDRPTIWRRTPEGVLALGREGR